MKNIDRLLQIMARLRDPVNGCPWDVKQTFETIAPYTLEEVYEVLDAIERRDMADLRDELGDLLLQVVFHARMAEEAGNFDFEAIAGAIADKLERRHPHVFKGQPITTEAELHQTWAEKKQAEKRAKQGADESILGDVPPALPALMFATKLQERAAGVGFDWPDMNGPLAKIEEELQELKAEIKSGNKAKITEEIGDLLFSICNLSRHLKLSPELSLKSSSNKFKNRFQYIEKETKNNNENLKSKSLDEFEELWQKAKKKA
ncbi:MAG: nucleoside triphosphate pyrophosphohydrolase [Alphaproteobacteria bacterium]|nr:MAG: nucleoside triphosphate pyrophosphohydrolase [Alphaproteobacteria bacterium]